jgi:hypothetical protein
VERDKDERNETLKSSLSRSYLYEVNYTTLSFKTRRAYMLNSAISSGLRNETVLSAERIDVRPQSSGYRTRTAALLAAFGWDV